MAREITPPQHTHAYPETYTFDSEFHWFECECGEDKGKAAHSFTDGKCVCGYEKKEEGGTAEHTHDYSTTNFDELKHWKECSCGDKKEITQHAYTDNKCTCGYTKPQNGHTHIAGEWIIETPATCTKIGYRYKKCSDCGVVIETSQIEYAEHNYLYGECEDCSAIDATYMTEGLMFVLNEEDDVYEVKGYNGLATKIIIPEIYRGKNVVIPEGASYSHGVFSDALIEEVVINAKKIGDYAFCDNKNIKKVVMGDSVTSIGDYAFYWCDSLTSVVIGDSVTSIGEGAFEDCDSLTSIKYRGTEAQWSAIEKGYYWDGYTGSYTITYNYDGE